MPVLCLGAPRQRKDVARPIADADPPLLGSRNGTHRFDYLCPHLAFLRTFGAGGAGLRAFLHFVPRPDPLGRYAQDLGYGGGPYRQTTMQKKATSARIADPAQTFRLAMGGEVQVTGILHKQDGIGVRGLLACGLPVRLAESRMRDVRFLEQ